MLWNSQIPHPRVILGIECLILWHTVPIERPQIPHHHILAEIGLVPGTQVLAPHERSDDIRRSAILLVVCAEIDRHLALLAAETTENAGGMLKLAEWEAIVLPPSATFGPKFYFLRPDCPTPRKFSQTRIAKSQQNATANHGI
jgi:hypothetical protein